MKRVKVSFFAGDKYAREDFTYANKGVVEIESYEEQRVSKDRMVEGEYTFERLIESGQEFINGLWHTGKGFVGMAGWAFVTIWEGLRWMWKGGLGKKKEKEVK
jgi:hypothetical protein